MKKTHSTLALLVLGLSVLLAGCSSVGKPDSITVTLVDLKAGTPATKEAQLVATLRFTSESLNAFGFSGSAHKLYCNGSYLGRAVSHTPLGLPPLTTTTRDLPLVLENPALVRQVLAAAGASGARYRLDTVLTATNGEDEVTVKSSAEGTVDLSHLPAWAR